MDEDRKKIVITSSDLNSTQVDKTVDHLQKAQDIVLVREVGEPTGNRDGLVTIAILSLAGVIAGFLIWVLWSNLPTPADSTSANLQSSFTITIAIAILLAVADSGLNRSLAKLGRSLLIAIPVAVAAGLAFGYAANSIYSAMVESTWQSLVDAGLSPLNESFFVEFGNRNHLNRGLAWSLLGLAAGIAVGAPSLALRRVLITSAGGFIGAFVGGFVFDYFQGEAEAQITGLVITGAAVGLSVSLLEQATKSSWLEITRGGMAGKQFILYQNSITIGSSPTANVTLIKDPAISPIAATIRRVGSTVTLITEDRSRPISVDGVSAFEHRLQEGSLITFGSTDVRFREKSKKINDTGIVKG